MSTAILQDHGARGAATSPAGARRRERAAMVASTDSPRRLEVATGGRPADGDGRSAGNRPSSRHRPRGPVSLALQPMRRSGTVTVTVLGIVAFALLLGVWELLTRTGQVDPLFLPSPEDTAATGVEMFRNGFLSDMWATVVRVMSGFVIAAVIGVPLGVLIGTYGPISSFLQPVFSFVRYMPASAFIPLFILWIGIDESEKVAVIILGSLPQIVLMVAGNIRNVPGSLIEASYTLGTNRANVLWKVIVPKAAPDVVDTLRIVLGWAWTYVIVAEIVGASSGIGYSILQSQRSMAVDRIFVAIVTLGLIGLVVDNVLLLINRIVFRWNDVKES